MSSARTARRADRRAQRVRVRLGAASYDVHVHPGGGDFVARALAHEQRRLCVVTDTQVFRHVWPSLAAAARRHRLDLGPPLVVRSGETRKTLSTVARLARELLRRGCDRRTCIVALGGGVIGDVAGFVAASYLRGVDWIAVPTSLLAMVDASVGGKVGVNLWRTKNAVGAFHQPRRVLVATSFLRTLPQRERQSGLAEAVKYGMIADARLFRALERDAERWRVPDAARDARLVARCVAIKAHYVAADERECGVRAALNFGHTIGHALEGDGRRGLLHGEAVGLGMLAACDIAARMGRADPACRVRLHALLRRLHLPTRYPGRIAVATLRRAWQRDKKSRAGTPRFVLTPRIGAVSVGQEVPDDLIVHALQGILDLHPRTRTRSRSRVGRQNSARSRGAR